MKSIIFLAGLILVLFSHPKIMRTVMNRLFNEGLVTPRRLPPEKAELVRFLGPNLSLLFVGIILIILGLVLKDS